MTKQSRDGLDEITTQRAANRTFIALVERPEPRRARPIVRDHWKIALRPGYQ